MGRPKQSVNWKSSESCLLFIVKFSNANVANINEVTIFPNITGSHVALKKKCRRLSYMLLSLVNI